MSRTLLVSCLVASLNLFAASPGIAPKVTVGEYAAHQATADVAIGASMVRTKEYSKRFNANLKSGGYIVVEVAVYPEQGKTVDLSPAAFRLLVERDGVGIHTADLPEIAAVLEKKNPAPPVVENRVSYGQSSGNDRLGAADVAPVDTATRGAPAGHNGDRRDEGLGRDVGINQVQNQVVKRPDRNAIEWELWTKSLPDAKVTRAVAGYLYFPKVASKSKSEKWELVWDRPEGPVKLLLEPK